MEELHNIMTKPPEGAYFVTCSISKAWKQGSKFASDGHRSIFFEDDLI